MVSEIFLSFEGANDHRGVAEIDPQAWEPYTVYKSFLEKIWLFFFKFSPILSPMEANEYHDVVNSDHRVMAGRI